jgi:uncharacterized protein
MNVLADRPLLYSARPVISVAGRDVPALSAAALSVGVRETASGLSSLECTFGNWGSGNGEVDYLYFDRTLLDFGAEIAIKLGAGDALGQVFRGRITALEGRFPQQRAPEILILAEDRLQDLRMTRRTRTFEQSSVTDLVNRIAADHGLDKTVDVETVTLPTVAQLNQSDLAFLRYLARIVDADVWFDGDKLQFKARPRQTATPVTLVYGQTLHEVSVSADLAHQRTAVVVSGWDVAAKEALNERAEDDRIQGELDGGVSGASVLSEKFGERVDQLAHESPLTTREAQARAVARFRGLARRFVTARGVGEGDARIRIGTRVRLNGLGPLFTGNYAVTETHHMFDYRTGYRTAFCGERAGLGRPS